jgi:hypothetical protein
MTADLNPEDEPKWRRRLGSGANNRAWTLSEQLSRTREEDDEMLNAAHASAYFWSTVGNEQNAALAHLLLGQVHALLGGAALAARYSKSASEFFTGRDSEPWELALSHAIAANAAHCSGDARSHQTEYAAALRAIETIADAEEKEIVLATMRVVPKPSTSGASGG